VQPVALGDGRRLTAEIGHRRIVVDGLYDLGTSFAVDGNTVTSRSTFCGCSRIVVMDSSISGSSACVRVLMRIRCGPN